jgi:hypothetical protein
MVKKTIALLALGSLASWNPLLAEVPDFETWADIVMHRLSGPRYDAADQNGDEQLTKEEWLAELDDEEEAYLVFEEADRDGDHLVSRDEAEIYTRDYRNLHRWYDQWILDNPQTGHSETSGSSTVQTP